MWGIARLIRCLGMFGKHHRGIKQVEGVHVKIEPGDLPAFLPTAVLPTRGVGSVESHLAIAHGQAGVVGLNPSTGLYCRPLSFIHHYRFPRRAQVGKLYGYGVGVEDELLVVLVYDLHENNNLVPGVGALGANDHMAICRDGRDVVFGFMDFLGHTGETHLQLLNGVAFQDHELHRNALVVVVRVLYVDFSSLGRNERHFRLCAGQGDNLQSCLDLLVQGIPHPKADLQGHADVQFFRYGPVGPAAVLVEAVVRLGLRDLQRLPVLVADFAP